MAHKRITNQHPIRRLQEYGTITDQQADACYELYDIILAERTNSTALHTMRRGAMCSRKITLERINLSKLRALADQWLVALADDAQLIFDMIEGALSFTAVARKHHIRLVSATGKLLAGLDLWIAMKAGTVF